MSLKILNELSYEDVSHTRQSVKLEDFSSEKMLQTMREMRSADSDSRKEKI